MQYRNKIFALVCAFSIIGGAAGCSEKTVQAGGNNSSEFQTYSAKPVGDLSSGDPYASYHAKNLLEISTAINELVYKCYAQNGYSEALEVLPDQKADNFRTMADTPDFITTFNSTSKSPWFDNVDEAKRDGLGQAAGGSPKRLYIADTSFASVNADCQKKSFEAAVPDLSDVYKEYVSIGNSLANSLFPVAESATTALRGKVYDCLTKKGYPLDPHGPNIDAAWGTDFGIPVGQVVPPVAPDLTKGGPVQVVPAVSSPSYTPTAKEAELAGDMFNCSVQSGARSEWQLRIDAGKKAAIEKVEARLVDLNPKIVAMVRTATQASQVSG